MPNLDGSAASYNAQYFRFPRDVTIRIARLEGRACGTCPPLYGCYDKGGRKICLPSVEAPEGFGPTADQLREFQRRWNIFIAQSGMPTELRGARLAVDGVQGPQTLRALEIASKAGLLENANLYPGSPGLFSAATFAAARTVWPSAYWAAA